MLPQSAYIKLVEGSTQETITLDDVRHKFERYIEQTGFTGKQLDWDYANAAFPYTIEQQPEAQKKWFYLKGHDPGMYNKLIVGVGTEPIDAGDMAHNTRNERHFIQIVLPDNAHHGDKAKGNEFCKYLAKQFRAELHLFNGRVMYFNPRK